MTSSNGNIFRVTGLLCVEFIGQRWIPTHNKGQWREALMFSLICAWTHGGANNRDADDLRRNRAHYDVTLMSPRRDGLWKTYCGFMSYCFVFPTMNQRQLSHCGLVTPWNLTLLVQEMACHLFGAESLPTPNASYTLRKSSELLNQIPESSLARMRFKMSGILFRPQCIKISNSFKRKMSFLAKCSLLVV